MRTNLRPSHPLRVAGSGIPQSATLAFGLLVFYKSLPFVPIDHARIASAVLIVFVAWCTLVSPPSARGSSRAILRIGSAWLLLSAAYLLPPLVSTGEIYLLWVLSDLALVLFPLGLLYAAERMPRMFTDRGFLALFAGLLFLAALAAATAGAFGDERFTPPSVALIAFVWLALLIEPRRRIRLALLALNLLIVLLCLLSGGREVALVWGIGGILALYIVGYGQKAVFFAVTACALVLGLTVVGVLTLPGADLGVSSELPTVKRFRTLSGPGGYEAMAPNRVNEARDVIEALQEGGTVDLLLGSGHGATYRPRRYIALPTLNEDGLTHHIHAGPLLLLYRYGLIGLSAYACVLVWFVVLLRMSRRSRRHNRVAGHELRDYFLLGAALYAISFLARNVLADPAFAFVFAGLLWHLYGSGGAGRPAISRQFKESAS